MTQFSCDERYQRASTDVPHTNGGASSVVLDISKTDLPADALVAYWVAEAPPDDDGGDVTGAANAYGEFGNSGIVQCADSLCAFTMDRPGRYTAEGKALGRHMHVTEWLGDRWNLDANTISLER